MKYPDQLWHVNYSTNYLFLRNCTLLFWKVVRIHSWGAMNALFGV